MAATLRIPLSEAKVGGVVHVGRFAESTTSGQRPDLQSLRFRRTKILDLVPKSDLVFGSPDYADKVVTYSVRRLKTNIIKVDNLFLK